MTTTYTTNLRFAKPDFRSPTWSGLVNGNFDSIDAAIINAITANNTTIWDNDTDFNVGNVAMDNVVDPPTYWIALEAHTSPASPTTFAQDRSAQPTRWSSIVFGVTPRGEWANSTDYNYYDIAYDSSQGIVALCLIAHTSNSSGDINDDSANWVFLIDLPSVGVTPATNISFDNTTPALPGAPANVQTAINAVDTRIDNAATIVADHETRLDSAEATIVSHTSTLSSHTSSLSTLDTRMDDAETDIASHESRLDGHDADIAGMGAGFVTGTAILFFQASAPTGWTKQTTYTDRAIRVTSGSGGAAGGSSAFSTVFGKTATDATTLTTSTIPAHTHSYDDYQGVLTGDTGSLATTDNDLANVVSSMTTRTSGSNGSGGSHTHPIDLRVHYLDVIICEKN